MIEGLTKAPPKACCMTCVHVDVFWADYYPAGGRSPVGKIACKANNYAVIVSDRYRPDYEASDLICPKFERKPE